ncbi:MAG: hypothetical protein M1826_001512 [Phylliscum demangeonii]|nr:MAG: hypothetical protein M1826_001512 [Phylliscum demangeonii]
MRNGRVSALGTNESSPVSSSEEWTDGSTVPEVSSHAAGFQHQPWTVRVVNSPDPSAPPTESGAQYRCSRGLPSPWFGGSRAAARERAWRRNAESAAEAIPAPPSPAFENPGDLVAGKATTEARTAKSNAANDPRPASVEAPGMLRTFGTLLSANLNRASWRLSMASNRSGEAFSLASSQDPISRPKRPPPADENAAQNRIPISNRGGDGPEIRFQINNRDSILSTFSEGEAGVIETATTAQRPMSSLSPGSAISCPSRPATPRIVDVRAKHPFSVAADKRAISHTGSLASGFRSEDGQAEMSSASHMAFL